MTEVNPNEYHRDPSALKGTRLRVEAAGPWVVRNKVKNAPRRNNEPLTMLLLDRQINADAQTRYTRYVRRLETPQAVQEAGRIELDFDPATQMLIIHGVSIFREGQLKNYASLDMVQVIQRERDLEKGIYAGAITALILLNDVRTEDIVDIETSIVSDDPIFGGHYWLRENFQHSITVVKQYFSWLARDQDRFRVTMDAEELEYEKESTEWGERKTWKKVGGEALDIPPMLPIGFNPFESLTLSSFASWQEVAAEVARLWKRKEEPGEELPNELMSLKKNYEAGSEELINEVVAFVRDNIRYQGVETGRLGLVPDSLDVIWSRRFGDCKEKTSMLCWMLRECGFDATPALVSFAMQGRVAESLPAPIFDHVVTYLNHEGREYWIDPTNISQRGSLRGWRSLPFQKALLISPETVDFKDIAETVAGLDFMKVREDYEFTRWTDAKLKVVHEYHGAEADSARHALDSSGRLELEKIFIELVRTTRPEAELATSLE